MGYVRHNVLGDLHFKKGKHTTYMVTVHCVHIALRLPRVTFRKKCPKKVSPYVLCSMLCVPYNNPGTCTNKTHCTVRYVCYYIRYMNILFYK